MKVEALENQDTIISTMEGELEIGVFMIALSSFVEATGEIEDGNPIEGMRQVAISMLETLLTTLEGVNFFEPLGDIVT